MLFIKNSPRSLAVSNKTTTFAESKLYFKNNGMNDIESNKGEIVMYQPDETIRLEVKTGKYMVTTKKCSKYLDNTNICSTFALS